MSGYKESLRQYFSAQAKALRKKRKLTQEEMSEQLHITVRAYQLSGHIDRSSHYFLSSQAAARNLRTCSPGAHGPQQRPAAKFSKVDLYYSRYFLKIQTPFPRLEKGGAA